MTKNKSKKFKISKDEQQQLIEYFAMELFDRTTLPQMLDLVQREAFNYAKSQIEGDDMPDDEKQKVLDRKIAFDKQMQERKSPQPS